MICEFKDGVKVDYSGSLHITKGNEKDFFVPDDAIPTNYKGMLDWALHSHNCSDMRRVAEEVTDELTRKTELI